MKSLLTCQEMFKDVYLQSPETAHFLLIGKNISFAISGLISRLISCVDFSLEIGSALKKTNEVV
jgi:hypothetical protein